MTSSEFNDRFDYDPDNDLLGEGGFGKIFKAWDNVRNEFIALKMSKVQPGMEQFSLLSEYERVKHLEHPNIARYMDCRRIKLPGIGTHDIALMKYYEHGNLSQLLGKHTLTEAQRQKIVDGLLDGIGYLHKLRPLIIHSDLKPSNVLIVERRGFYIPLVTDFGISRQATVEDKSYVTNLTGAGTYAYAAPEQWEAKELRPNADLWSFAILAIYVWFNGKKLPFRSDDISIATDSGRIEYMKRVLALDFIADLKGLPVEFKKMIELCLVIDPQVRIKSVDALLVTIKGEILGVIDEQTRILSDQPPLKPSFYTSDEKTQILKPEPAALVAEIQKERAVQPATEDQIKPKRKYLLLASMITAAAAGAVGWYIFASGIKPERVKVSRVLTDTVTSVIKKPELPKAPIVMVDKTKPREFKKGRQLPQENKAGLAKGSVYVLVEEPPVFPDGIAAMNNWLKTNLHMPEDAARSFVSGVVRVSFVVNTDGSLGDIQILKGLGFGCDEEAMRLIKAMPRWTAGKTAHAAVRVRQTINIVF